MEKIPARAGWLWVKQGLLLFRKQPGGLLALFFCCMFLSMAMLIVPVLGSIAPIVLAPLFSMALLQACAQVDQGKRALPNLVFIGFRKPARGALLKLGGLYLLVMLLSLGVLSWMDDGMLVQMATGRVKMDPAALEGSRGAIFVSSAIYMLGWLLSCMATPLIYWQKMNLGKALFFSVVAVLRGIKAFLTGALILFAFYQLGSMIPMVLFSSMELQVTMIFSIFLILLVIMHCTLYASYCQIFGAPAAEPPAAPQPGT